MLVEEVGEAGPDIDEAPKGMGTVSRDGRSG